MAGQATGVFTPEEVVEILSSASGEAFNDYLTLFAETEPPRQYLIWSLIASAAALIGKNSALFLDETRIIYPNLYVILIGPTGTRKSSAMNLIRPMLDSTSIYFGPTDTGNARQGLMSALIGAHRSDGRRLRELLMKGAMTRAMIRPREPTDMTLFSPELGQLLGSNNMDLMNFFVNLFDGESIDYQTKGSEVLAYRPRATILGATTPSNLAAIMPENAPEHGIMARMIYVYADKKHKEIPLPPERKEEWKEAYEKFRERLHWIDENRAPFTLNQSGREAYTQLYTFIPHTEDPRLGGYRERRADFLLRVAMCIAALRSDTDVNSWDIRYAHELLHAIEPTMHKAFEYLGRNKKHQGRMLIINYLKAHQTATEEELIAAAASELNAREAREALTGLQANQEVVRVASRYALGVARNQLGKSKHN